MCEIVESVNCKEVDCERGLLSVRSKLFVLRMLGLRPCRVRSGWHPVKGRRTEVRCAATRAFQRLRVEFSVPYRVQFGQRLNLVGSGVRFPRL